MFVHVESRERGLEGKREGESNRTGRAKERAFEETYRFDSLFVRLSHKLVIYQCVRLQGHGEIRDTSFAMGKQENAEGIINYVPLGD